MSEPVYRYGGSFPRMTTNKPSLTKKQMDDVASAFSKATFQERALRVIDVAYDGQHHVWSLKWNDPRWCSNGCTFLVGEMASTYDFAQLTKLVVACHDECVRGEIRNGGPGRLRIILTPRERKSKHPDSCAHPKLEQHVEQIRKGGSYQPLFEQLREGD